MRMKHVPMRSCVACRTKGPKGDFIRLVRSPEGEVLVDPPRRVPGRGAYLCRRLKCWEEGLSRGRLISALKGPIAPKTREELIAKARAWYGEIEHARVDASESLNS